MRNVVLAIIGSGQIGSRHLQSIARLDRDAEVYLVDPSEKSLDLALERYDQIRDDNKHRFPKKNILLKEIKDLPHHIDLAIVATTAHNRLKIIGSLLERRTVNFLILEKVVFQKPDDFDTAQTLFEKSRVKVWVNCPRRYWPGYIHIRDIIKKTSHSSTSMTVSGARWGLCSNTIHFLDLYAFITGIYDLDLRNETQDLDLVPAKRQDTIEMSGTIDGYHHQGGTIRIRDYHESDLPLQITFENPSIRCIIDERLDTIHISGSHNSWNVEEIPLQTRVQSQLTHTCIQEILETGNSRLPAFGESMITHKLLLNLLMDQLSRITGKEASLCPIT